MRNLLIVPAVGILLAALAHTDAHAAGRTATIGGLTQEVCATPTVTASLAYGAGNEVGGLVTFTNAFQSPPQTAILQSIRLTVKSVQTAEFDVTFFSQNPSNSTWTDKSAPAIAAGDVPFVQPVIKLTNNFSGLGTHTVYGSDNISRAVKMTGLVASTSAYAIITTPGTPTFNSTSDVQLCASWRQD